MARPTRSLVKYIQQVGRGLRRNGDKQCLILDNVGMYGRFGLPDDNRPWEQYFEGGPSSSIRQLRNKTNRDNIGLGTPRERDLSEGLDEMKLIQQVDIETESEIIVISRQEDTDLIILKCALQPSMRSITLWKLTKNILLRISGIMSGNSFVD